LEDEDAKEYGLDTKKNNKKDNLSEEDDEDEDDDEGEGGEDDEDDEVMHTYIVNQIRFVDALTFFM
jgi:U3 small nucleolar RNA-associated protein MPP10